MYLHLNVTSSAVAFKLLMTFSMMLSNGPPPGDQAMIHSPLNESTCMVRPSAVKQIAIQTTNFYCHLINKTFPNYLLHILIFKHHITLLFA